VSLPSSVRTADTLRGRPWSNSFATLGAAFTALNANGTQTGNNVTVTINCDTNEGTTSPQAYVQSLTGVPGRWQVSTAAGVFPTWTRGGKELMFIAADGFTIMSAEVSTGA
jgi:hypothetical protein